MTTLIYNHSTGEIVDSEDGQILATMSDSATKEQGELLVSSYNATAIKYTPNSITSALPTEFLPQGPGCVNDLIKASLAALTRIDDKDMQSTLAIAINAFTEYSVPVAWSADDISNNISKSEATSELSQGEQFEVFNALIRTASDETSQEKIHDIATRVLEHRADLNKSNTEVAKKPRYK